jgi:hypothetical protein
MATQFIVFNKSDRASYFPLLEQAVAHARAIGEKFVDIRDDTGFRQLMAIPDDGKVANYIRPDGSPVPPHHCVLPDNYVIKFTVEVRAMSGVSADAIREQLQKRWEVLSVQKTDTTIVVR